MGPSASLNRWKAMREIPALSPLREWMFQEKLGDKE
jgi:hypothetical protein